MKNIRFILFVVFAVVSVAAPLSIIWKHEATLRYGKTYKFRTKPVDPYDAFRGRYVNLSFEQDSVSVPDSNSRFSREGILYVKLAVDADGFAKPVQVSKVPLTGDDVIIVDDAWYNGDQLQLSYPFDRYYLPEDIAPKAEQLYWQANRRGANQQSQAYVTVKVRDGVGVLEELYIDGKPIREVIKAGLAEQTKNER
jgi:uncharacterized membrane-anchored protein